MPLSRRLSQIDHMVTQHYSHIWDCCCDHGQLGIALLERHAAETVHFVDVVAPLMDELQQRLQAAPQPHEGAWQVHCLDVALLPISHTPSKDTHLIIIAGIGGDLMIDLINAIIANHPQRPLEFLLCPVYHQYKLRSALINKGLTLKAEHLLRDNKQFYEILHVSTHPEKSDLNFSAVGDSMWDFSKEEHRDYHQRMLQHYGRMTKRTDINAEEVLEEYRALAV